MACGSLNQELWRLNQPQPLASHDLARLLRRTSRTFCCVRLLRRKKRKRCPNSRPIHALGTTPVPRHPPSVKSVSEQVRPAARCDRCIYSILNDKGKLLPLLLLLLLHRPLYIRVQRHPPVRLAPVAHGPAPGSATPRQIKGGRWERRRA